mmetsp:Transcript_3722/g.5445  ORF Transcript_3722/g.5445 Transcript_3722/m.5445 type:complete len:231 (+) Transcript_3722:1-693(+)
MSSNTHLKDDNDTTPPPISSIIITAPTETSTTTTTSSSSTPPTAPSFHTKTPASTPTVPPKKTICMSNSEADTGETADDEMEVEDATKKYRQQFKDFQSKSSGGIMVTPSKKLKKRQSKSKSLTWDEHAIEEHDLLRGTRMKIDEPNTPYTHYDHHSEQSDDDTQASASSSSAILPHVTTTADGTTTTTTTPPTATKAARLLRQPQSPSHEDQQNSHKLNLAMHWDLFRA